MIAPLAPGVWRWSAPHPEWRPRNPWVRECACYALDTSPELALVDPLAPPDPAPLWSALDALIEQLEPERLVVLTTIHYHVRSASAVARRYRGRLPVSVHGHPSVPARLGRARRRQARGLVPR